MTENCVIYIKLVSYNYTDKDGYEEIDYYWSVVKPE